MATEPVTERIVSLVAQMGGLAILAATLAAVTAVVYRWYVKESVPRGLSLLIGLSGVAVYLNTSRALGQVIAGSTVPTEAEQALFNIAAIAIAAGGAVVGRRAGDQFGTDVVLGGGLTDVDREVGRFVQSVGRVIAVELPHDIDDVTGYDPIPAETKAELAGRTFLFPRRLTVSELRERLVHRLKTDYAVGHVDVELADDGSIDYLALGSRPAGIGPTLPPATNAVAIRADPAFASSTGDLVQVWEQSPMRRVLTAELRGVAEETVTIAIDAGDTTKIDPRVEYRLVTLPVTDRPDREFASLLRAADETFSSVTVEAGSPLHGLPIGSLALSVVAIKSDGEAPATLPSPSYVLTPGDTVYAIARPETLRRLETAAEPLESSLASPPEPATDREQPEAARTDEGEQGQRPPDSPDTNRTPETRASGDQKTAAASDTAENEPPDRQATPDGSQSRQAEAEDSDTADPIDPSDDLFDETVEVDDQDDDLDALAEDDQDDDLDALAEDDDPEEAVDESEDDEDDENEADENDEETGTPSFQQLKEEFESGEADWEDDISDSPGGDMRLDE
jgi:hypothetical protein